MGNVIGEPLKDYVIRQIEARQKLYGSGAGPNLEPRTDVQINLISSPTAWIKLASAVQITDSKRLTEIGVDSSLTNLLLAKKFILSSGLSELSNNNLINRGGFDPLSTNLNSSYTYGQYGYVPMPGLISADIKTLNRGSIKKATVKLIAQDSQQFQIIDLLYLRLGYTVLLEWGNSLYTKTGTDKNILRETILEKDFYTNKDFRKVIDKIEVERDIHEGNYDGFLAKVSNFSWSVNNDGSYDIELTLISLGDVVESLKTNISPDTNTVNFISATQTVTVASSTPPIAKNDEDTESPTETNQVSSIVHSMLYLWKWIDEVNKGRQANYPELTNTFSGTPSVYGYNLSNKPSFSSNSNTITLGTKKYIFLFHGAINIYIDPEFVRRNGYNGQSDWDSLTISDPSTSPSKKITANIDVNGIPFLTGVTLAQIGDQYSGVSLKDRNGYNWYGKITFARFGFEEVQIDQTKDTPDYRYELFEQKIFEWGKRYFGSVQGEGYLTVYGGPNSNKTSFPQDKIFSAASGSEDLKSSYNYERGFYGDWKTDISTYNGLYSLYPDNRKVNWTFGSNFAVDGGGDDAHIEGNIYNTDYIGGGANAKNAILATYIKEDTGAAGSITIANPLKDAKTNDAVKITSVVPHYYLRLGFLLDYIKKNVIPKIVSQGSSNPIIDIQYNDNDIMFSVEDQISLDPRVCIVRNNDFLGDKIYQGACLPFRVVDDTSFLSGTLVTPEFAGYVMNIYLNFDFIIESLTGDERGDVNLFDFIRNICTGINKALGGINNLEPVLDEDTNTLRIIDTTPIPGTVRGTNPTSYTLLLTGYQNNSTGKNYISNFIRKVDLKTAITPEFATMITVGATTGGYVKGTDATAFSKWNQGLVDLYKEEVEPGNEETAKQAKSGTDEAITNWDKKIVKAPYDARLGFSTIADENGASLGIDLKDSIIQGNISFGTEYYKYYVAKESNTGNGGGGSIGFIPFKLSFTMDGLSGVKIYNKLNVDTSFLPQAYGNKLDLIVTGVSHRLQNQDWETSIETTVIPTSNPSKSSRRFTGGVVSAGTPTPPSTTPSTGGTKLNGTNGRLPESDLVVVVTKGGRQYKLNKNAAEAYNNLKEAAKNAGFNLDRALSSAYRSVDDQIRVRRGNLKDKSKKDDINYLMTAPSSAFNLPTGKPGYSNHGFGKAIDVSKGDCNNWLRRNAYKYGWWWYGPSDPVHFTYGTKSESGHPGYIT